MTEEQKQLELVWLAKKLIKLDEADPTGMMAWNQMEELTERILQKLNKDD